MSDSATLDVAGNGPECADEAANPDTGTSSPPASAPSRSNSHEDICFPERGTSDSSSQGSTSPFPDDMSPGGHHIARVGDTLKGGRYRVLARLGAGHFSTVWLCYDSQGKSPAGASPSIEGCETGSAVAVKIQKSSQRYTDAAHDEILLLRGVRREDPDGGEPVVSLLDSFAHSGPNGRHMCLVFDVMGPSLLSLIKRFRYRGVPLSLVRRLARNILQGLQFLHERPSIVHTDLKPENILMWPSANDYDALHREAARFARQLVAQKSRRARSGSRSTEHATAAASCDAPAAASASRLPTCPSDASVATPAAAASSSGRPSANSPDTQTGSALTKNQKKRMKAKARKAKRKLHATDDSSARDEIDDLLGLDAGAVPVPVPTSTLSQSSSHSSASFGSGDLEKSRAQSADKAALSDARDEGCTAEGEKRRPDANESESVVQRQPACESGSAGRGAVGDGSGEAPQAKCADGVTGDAGGEERDAGAGEKFCVGSILRDDDLFRRGSVCIIDLGNACWTSSSSSGVIQTRQYRSPEVITGGRFGPSADMWSAGCLLFELATGEFLFDPHSGRDYDRDEDHLAQMIELLGPVPREVSSRGAYARELFNRRGELRHIRELSFWSLDHVLRENYEFSRTDATEFADFLRQMLRFDPRERLSAAECLAHPFLTLQGHTRAR